MASRSRTFRRSSAAAMARHVAQQAGLAAALKDEVTGAQLAEVFARDRLPGRWIGRGAAKLELGELVRMPDILAVMRDGVLKRPDPLDPLAPDTEIRLRGAGAEVGFYGVILALPKSVSLLLASDDPAEREAAEEAARVAERVFLETLEGLVRTRTGRDGVNSVSGDGLIAASFTHRGSSAGDPHLHVHFMISNSTQGSDYAWRTIDSKLFMSSQRVATAAAMRAMKACISELLGLSEDAWLSRQVGSVQTPELRDLAGAAENLSRASERLWRDRVKSGLHRTIDDRLDHHLWRLDREANAADYEKIEAEIDLTLANGGENADRLRADWRTLGGAALEKGLAGLRARRGGEAPSPSPSRRKRGGYDQKAALDFICGQEIFCLTDLAAWMVGEGVPAADSMLKAAKFLDAAAAEGLVHMTGKLSPTVFAMQEGLAVDTRRAHAVAGIGGRIVTDRRVQWEARMIEEFSALARQQRQRLLIEVPETATVEQSIALRLIAEGRGLCAIRGVAGAGKSFILKPAAEAARRQGMEVIAIARNAKIGRNLGQDIEANAAMSIADFLTRHQSRVGKARKPTLLVIDESGVVDEADLLAVLRLAADPASQIQVVMTGDRSQSQSIDRKATWGVLTRAAEQAGAVAELKTSFRNRAWAAEAQALREGDARAVVDAAARGGRLKTANSADYARVVAALWAEHPGSLVVTYTNEEAARISAEIQKLKEIEPVVEIARDQGCGVGDTIRTRRNDHDRSIYNGDTWEVIGAEEDGIFVENAAGRVVFLTSEYVKQHVELGYASTLDSAQGMTVDRAIFVGRAGLGRNQMYSGSTRGRAAPIYVMVSDEEQPEAVLASILETDDTIATADERVEEIAAKADELKKPRRLDAERERVEAERAARVAKTVRIWEAIKAAGGAEVSSLRQMTGVIRRASAAIHEQERLALERRQNRENRRFDLYEVLEANRAGLLEAERQLDRLSEALAAERARKLPETATRAAHQAQAQRIATLEALLENQRGLYGRVAERWQGVETNCAARLAEIDEIDASDRAWQADFLGRLRGEADAAEAGIKDFLARAAGRQARPKATGSGPEVT
ncbi:MobF family relaxase [Acidiphilium cryptum]|uniref:ATP-dependent exoDNAse (Exonuclease V) alpha subunit-helicase superfamily I member-like protein n=1 Tax=Acidiphilium cryptum (strain JF-5) TaxID=349163 RepID=A5FUD0_ACICJ|nr:MobF family relaxase [Acidiphilium cryptum]ABQ29212.1 ATP-dependent exoDNAse (exonuclease V) alpha subunit - helicase superfamily I member-like protein [Acidiphilium cryptum JF-5]